MSIHAISWAFEQKLSCAQKMILIALADQCGRDYECWPSQKYLSDRCGLSRPYVNTLLGELEAGGYLFISSRTRHNGADSSNLYILAVPDDAATEAQSERNDIRGVVYVIGDGNRCKIGISRQFQRRHQQLETIVGRSLKVAGTIECSMAAARNLEKLAHEHFDKWRTKGEWFEIQGIVAINWLTAKSSGMVLTGLTPPVSPQKTRGVNHADTGVSTQKTPIIEPTISNLPNEPLRSPRGREPDGFAEWYAIYPRHVGRGQAKRAFQTALKKIDLPALAAATERFAAECGGKDQNFIPHPATWLNGERWADEAVVTQAKPAPEFEDTDLVGWRKRAQIFLSDPIVKPWKKSWGGRPDQIGPARRMPPEVLAEFGFHV